MHVTYVRNVKFEVYVEMFLRFQRPIPQSCLCIVVREIAEAIKVSRPYAALIRAGRQRPHPRHWQSLAKLAGHIVVWVSPQASD